MTPGEEAAPGQRVRRPSDVLRLVAAATGFLLVMVATLRAPDMSGAVVGVVPTVDRGALRAVFSIASVVASFGVLGVLLTVAIDAAGGAVTELLTRPANDAALVPVVASVAFLVGADLQRRRRWRQPTRWSVLGASGCAVALGNLALAGAVAAMLLGAVAGLAVRVVHGVPPARPRDDVIRAELARAGSAVGSLQATEQAAGFLRLSGDDVAGPVHVTVVDPDGRGVPLARRAGRLLRFRAAVVGCPALSQRGGLERQASSAALATAAGVAVPRILALLSVGPALVLAERPLTGTPLPAAGERAASGLAAAFAAPRRLHDVGLAHGALTPYCIVLGPDGDAGFGDLRSAQPAAGTVAALLLASQLSQVSIVDELRQADPWCW